MCFKSIRQSYDRVRSFVDTIHDRGILYDKISDFLEKVAPHPGKLGRGSAVCLNISLRGSPKAITHEPEQFRKFLAFRNVFIQFYAVPAQSLHIPGRRLAHQKSCGA